MVDYSYFWSGGEPIISCFVHHWLTSMPNVKHTEYLKNTKIVHYKYPKAFIVERRPEIIVRKNDCNKNCCWRRRGWGRYLEKSNMEVLLWSSNPVFNVGGQAGPGNEISNVSKVWPEKSDWDKNIFSFHFPHYIALRVPPRSFSLGVLWRNRLVLKAPHQGTEIPKDIPLQGLTNE